MFLLIFISIIYPTNNNYLRFIIISLVRSKSVCIEFNHYKLRSLLWPHHTASCPASAAKLLSAFDSRAPSQCSFLTAILPFATSLHLIATGPFRLLMTTTPISVAFPGEWSDTKYPAIDDTSWQPLSVAKSAVAKGQRGGQRRWLSLCTVGST